VSDKLLDLRKCNFAGKDLSGKTLAGALLVDTDLSNSKLRETVLTKVVRGAGAPAAQSHVERHARVYGSSHAPPPAIIELTHAHPPSSPTQSYAVSSNLEGADLTNAVVDRVDFTNANLKRAQFVNAVVTGTLFDGADLSETVWEDALIGEAVWGGVRAEQSCQPACFMQALAAHAASPTHPNVSALTATARQ
jgi:uncharacterized protein YjbI with pentapeptide repeats